MKNPTRSRFLLVFIVLLVLVVFFRKAPTEPQPQPEKPPVVKMNIQRDLPPPPPAPTPTLDSITVRTHGNWAYNRAPQQTFVELLDAQDKTLSKSYLPAFMAARRGETISLSGIEASGIRVHFFTGSNLTSLDFDLPDELLTLKNPELFFLISPYKLSPRARWQNEEGQASYFWPRGRETWTTSNQALIKDLRPTKTKPVVETTVQTVIKAPKKKVYVSKESVAYRGQKAEQLHDSYKWRNWRRHIEK